jgi:hypothetical protein
VLAWWCLVLGHCLSWFFEVGVGVLWILYLQWHRLLSWVLLLYLPPPCSSHSFSLLYSLSLLILSQIPNQLESSNINHEDIYNEGNINIPLATSSLERKMMGYIAAQTQVLQAMAQTMVKIHQSITEQDSLHKSHNTVTNDNHQNMTPSPFEKQKLSTMQTQVLQGRMQPSTTYFCNEMAKDRIPLGQWRGKLLKHGIIKERRSMKHWN